MNDPATEIAIISAAFLVGILALFAGYAGARRVIQSGHTWDHRPWWHPRRYRERGRLLERLREPERLREQERREEARLEREQDLREQLWWWRELGVLTWIRRQPRLGGRRWGEGWAQRGPTVADVDEYELLVNMLQGEWEKAERLIAYEGRRSPSADRSQLIRDAVVRLLRDRR